MKTDIEKQFLINLLSHIYYVKTDDEKQF